MTVVPQAGLAVSGIVKGRDAWKLTTNVEWWEDRGNPTGKAAFLSREEVRGEKMASLFCLGGP